LERFAAKVNRKDFGLVWNAALEAGGILVGDEVTITLDVQFTKPEHQAGRVAESPPTVSLGTGAGAPS
jgi:YceI-like protein